MVICEHCNNELANIYSLRKHKLTNLRCLRIQGINIDDLDRYMCTTCDKVFINKGEFTRHIKNDKTCILKSNHSEEIDELNKDHSKEIDELKKDHSKEINELEIKYTKQINDNKKDHSKEIDELNKDHSEEIDELNKQIMLLENSNAIYKKLSDKPTTVNNNHNKYLINSFSLMNNRERMKDIIDKELNESHVLDGQKGISKFVCDSIVKDEVGNLNYICTDPSRSVYKFMNDDGEIEKDPKAKKLTNALISSNIKTKSIEIAENFWTNEDGKVNKNRHDMTFPMLTEILDLKKNNVKFRTEMESSINV